MSTPFYKPRFLRLFTGLVYLYLFIPIVIVIVFSFNSEKSLQVMQGFSFRWYSDFFNDPTLMDSLVTSVQIAVLTMIISTVIGTALAIGLVRAHSGTSKGFNILMLVPLITPEIVAGISALLIFSQLGIGLSIWTIVIAHITFSISYVTIVVRGRLATIGDEVEQVAVMGSRRDALASGAAGAGTELGAGDRRRGLLTFALPSTTSCSSSSPARTPSRCRCGPGRRSGSGSR